MTTDHAAFIEEARPLIEFIKSKDGPKLPDWCVATRDPRIYGQLSKIDLMGCVECPPAVTAAICMWITSKVQLWWISKPRIGDLVPSDMRVPKLFSDNWEYYDGEQMRSVRGYTESMLGYLAAICEQLGYEGFNR